MFSPFFTARLSLASRSTTWSIHRSIFWSIFVLLLMSVSFTPQAQATIQLPKQLSSSDRQEALRILGFGMSTKILSDPYPLGGYYGVEIGIAVESLPTEEIGRLGSRLPTPQADVSYPKFTLGKGLYNDVDVFLQFTPYNRQDELSNFGALVRWGFYQAQSSGFNASVVVHGSSGNVSNLLVTRAFGADLIGGVNVKNVALYGGLGVIQASGRFMGGANGITPSASIEEENVNGFHTVVGVNIHLSNFFLALQLDRYTLPVFSGKLGVRF